MLKRIFAALVAVAAAGAAGVATASSASAAAPLTDTVHIRGNLDNGNHGYWAKLDYNRTVRITRASKSTWNVVLKDVGSFTTLKGAKSPAAGATIAGSMPGTFAGTFRFTVTSTSKPDASKVRSGYNFRCNPAVPNRGDCPGMPATTSNWPALYFGPGTTVTAGTWKWDYETCKEAWTTSNAGDTGDITGRPCVEPVIPAAPAVQQPTCQVKKGTITAPATTGVEYMLWEGNFGKTMVAGRPYKVAPGTVRVVASATGGYRIERGVQREWLITVNPVPQACETPSPNA